MTLIKAENRELTHSRYSSTKGIPTVKIRRPTARGYYLALTFGTLLSSQGADAHEPRPSGLRSRRLSMLRLAEYRSLPRGVRSAGLPARLAQRRHYTILRARAGSPRAWSVCLV